MKNMLLLRGIPSSGKSTLADKLQSRFETAFNKVVILSTDNYFIKDGIYTFDRAKLSDAHQWNQSEVFNACSFGWDVIIDNTNTTWKEIEPYLKYAKMYNYFVTEIILNNPWSWDVEECFKRNRHGVPLETIQRMKDRFEYNLQPSINEYMFYEE